MFVVADKKRVQVSLDMQYRNKLIDLAGDMSKSGDKEVAMGAIAATLLTSLLQNYPDLVNEILGRDVAVAAKKASGKRQP